MTSTSEFVCEVVRVTKVSDHPNADRLVCVEIETKDGPSSYKIIHGKGQIAVGDLAVYCSVDSLVPVTEDRWEFLRSRLDYRKGSEFYRLKAARLRGLYSEGLLVVADGLKFGTEMADSWGIVKYVRPEDVESPTAQGAPKSRSKKKITPHVFPEYSICSYRKVPFLIPEGTEVEITEKIHGCNFRAGWIPIGKGYKWVVGSHRAVKSDVRSWWEKLTDWVLSRGKTKMHWYGTDVWSYVSEFYSLKERMRGLPGVVIYGEIFGHTQNGKPIQDLTYGCNFPHLRLFDAWLCRDRGYLGSERLRYVANHIGMQCVPTLLSGRWGEELKERAFKLAEEDSCYLEGQMREGVVIRETNGQARLKYISQRYSMREVE